MNRVCKLLVAAAVIMALPTPALAVSVKPPVVDSAHMTTVQGALEYDISINGGHYRVADYLLIYKNPDELSELLGKEVVVQGRILKEPTIYMRPVMEVEFIIVKGLPHQSDDVSIQPVPTVPDRGPVTSPNPITPVEDPAHDGPITIQPYPMPIVDEPGTVRPAPAPHEDDIVTIQPHPYPIEEGPITIQPYPMPIVDEPVTIQPYPMPIVDEPVTIQPYPMPIVDEPITIQPYPMPVVGTPYVALYGMVELQDGAFHLTEWIPGGAICWAVYSDQVDLKAWLGQRVAVVASAEKVAGGHHLYRVEKLMPTTLDLAGLIDSGKAILYQRPATKVQVLLNGEPVVMDQAPIFGNGRTLVPLRAIAEATGAHVGWNEGAQTVTVTLSDRQVLVRIGSNVVTVRRAGQPDQVVLNDTAPVVVGGRTMVPARIISEGLGLSVHWDAESFTVSLQ